MDAAIQDETPSGGTTLPALQNVPARNLTRNLPPGGPSESERSLTPLERAALDQISAARKAIISQELEILRNGGVVPEVLMRIQPGDVMRFSDGAEFKVRTPVPFTSNFVSFDIMNLDGAKLPSTDSVRLVVAGYSDENPAQKVISNGISPNSNPRETLKFIRANAAQLAEIIPMCRYLKIAEDGSYALVEKIPDYNGGLMTASRFLTDKTISQEDRMKLMASLANFLHSAQVRFPTLDIPDTLVFDPRDSRWKMLTVDPHMRRFLGDNMASALAVFLELHEEADPRFSSEYFRELNEEIQMGAREIANKKRLENLSGVSGNYAYEIKLDSGHRIAGELDFSSLSRKAGERVRATGEWIDKEGNSRASGDQTFPIDAFKKNGEGIQFVLSNFISAPELAPNFYWIPIPKLPGGSKTVDVESRIVDADGRDLGWGKVGTATLRRLP